MHVFENRLKDSCRIQNNPRVMKMKVWRLVMLLFLELEWPPSELTWDKYTDNFIAVNFLDAPPYHLSSWNSSPGPQTSDGSPPALGGKTASLTPLRPKPSR